MTGGSDAFFEFSLFMCFHEIWLIIIRGAEAIVLSAEL